MENSLFMFMKGALYLQSSAQALVSTTHLLKGLKNSLGHGRRD